MKATTMIALAAAIGSIVPFAIAGTVHDVIVGPGGLFVFLPDEIVIEVGDTVRWTWESDGHNVESGLPGAPTDAFLSGPPAGAGTIFEFVFDQKFLDANPIPDNIYDYYCDPHGKGFDMIGSVEVLVPSLCPWDLDDSGVVGVSDFLELLGAWGPCPPKGDCSADFDGSGDVGVSDFLDLLGNWGPCP